MGDAILDVGFLIFNWRRDCSRPAVPRHAYVRILDCRRALEAGGWFRRRGEERLVFGLSGIFGGIGFELAIVGFHAFEGLHDIVG